MGLYEVVKNMFSSDPGRKYLNYYGVYDDFLNHHQPTPKKLSK